MAATISVVHVYGPTGREEAGAVGTLVLALLLAIAHVVSQHFPVHARQSTKLLLSTVPSYLMIVLLPTPLAISAVLLSQVVGEISLRGEKGQYFSDIATQTGRTVAVAALGACIFHALNPHLTSNPVPLFIVAAVLYAGDILTLPLVVMPVTHEPALLILRSVLRETSVLECGLYLVGILGAAAGMHAPWAISLLLVPMGFTYFLGKRNKELQSNTQMLLESMADAVDLRDTYTGGHSRRVTEFCNGTLREMGLHGPDVDLILWAARVHDIGKIGIPDAVLLKDGKLTAEEWAIMTTHPERGADLLSRYPDFARGAEIVVHHHEQWDGGGYPHGLRGTSIPFGSRVIAVADSYDAMTSDRPYRTGMPVTRAVQVLRDGRGRQWDAEVVDAFLASIADRLPEARSHPAAPQGPRIVSHPAATP